MRWTRSHSAICVGVATFAALAYFGVSLLQGEQAQQTAAIDTNTGVPAMAPAGGVAHSAALSDAAQQLSSCRGASPFVKNANCFQEPEPEANAGPPTDGTAMALPQFENVYVMGALGQGVAAKLLGAAGRNLAGTAGNHDSVLVDVSTTAADAAPVLSSITQALDEGKFVIVDGGDSKASSKKLNEIMGGIQLLQIEGVTAYGVAKTSDGAYHVTPLQSVVGPNGKREIDQLHQVLGIQKPGFDS